MKLSSEIVTQIAKDLEIGLALSDAAAAAGLDYRGLRVQLARGRKRKSGLERELWQAVNKAHATYRRAAAKALLKAAAAGVPLALSTVLDQAKSHEADISYEPPPTDPL
jgi:hypothetical protein